MAVSLAILGENNLRRAHWQAREIDRDRPTAIVKDLQPPTAFLMTTVRVFGENRVHLPERDGNQF
uniref:Uncharacterized protein n=1 Tax=Amphimedon queenslandica TaxID=400682 RepID=A0A1X7TFJ8_AMPQE